MIIKGTGTAGAACLTAWITEDYREDGVDDPLVGVGQVQGDHADEQRQDPDLAYHGGEGELVPDLAEVGQDQHRDYCCWRGGLVYQED